MNLQLPNVRQHFRMLKKFLIIDNINRFQGFLQIRFFKLTNRMHGKD